MRFLLAMALCFSSIQLANAGDLLETYTAKLGTQDHFNSSGKRLTSASAIIRQDRANFHKFNKVDTQDERDSYFSSREHRAKMESMFRNGAASKSTLKKIVNGTPTIVVYIYEDSVYVEVQ